MDVALDAENGPVYVLFLRLEVSEIGDRHLGTFLVLVHASHRADTFGENGNTGDDKKSCGILIVLVDDAT